MKKKNTPCPNEIRIERGVADKETTLSADAGISRTADPSPVALPPAASPGDPAGTRSPPFASRPGGYRRRRCILPDEGLRRSGTRRGSPGCPQSNDNRYSRLPDGHPPGEEIATTFPLTRKPAFVVAIPSPLFSIYHIYVDPVPAWARTGATVTCRTARSICMSPPPPHLDPQEERFSPSPGTPLPGNGDRRLPPPQATAPVSIPASSFFPNGLFRFLPRWMHESGKTLGPRNAEPLRIQYIPYGSIEKTDPGAASRRRLLHRLHARVRSFRRGQPEPLRVLTSFLPMEIFTRNVVGDTPGVTVVSMLPASTGCPPRLRPHPGDLRKIASADLFVANRLGMEEFLGSRSDGRTRRSANA